MKKLLHILALLVLLVGMAVSASAASALVLDQADLLRPQEEKVLQQSLDQVNQKYQVRLAVVTVKSTGGVKTGEFANVLLDKLKDSRLKGNMVLLLSMKERDWYISTDNGMRKMITDKAGIKALSGKFLPALKKNNYPKAFGQFAKGTDELLAYYQKEGKPYDPADAFNPLALAIGAAESSEKEEPWKERTFGGRWSACASWLFLLVCRSWQELPAEKESMAGNWTPCMI